MRGLVIALILILSGCSLEQRVEKQLRRAERKIEKLTILYPQLLKRDTINDTIQITIPQVEVDTFFKEKMVILSLYIRTGLESNTFGRVILSIYQASVRLIQSIKLYLYLLSKSW